MTIERDKNINTIILILLGYTLLRMVTTDGLVSTIVNRIFINPAEFIFYTLTFILPLPGLALFWYMKRSGYILILICVAYSFTNSALLVFREFTSIGYGPILDRASLFLPIGIYAYVLILLCMPNLRHNYVVNKILSAVIIAVGALTAYFA
jgi:hypothetical protein